MHKGNNPVEALRRYCDVFWNSGCINLAIYPENLKQRVHELDQPNIRLGLIQFRIFRENKTKLGSPTFIQF